jgi:hypothetical protein
VKEIEQKAVDMFIEKIRAKLAKLTMSDIVMQATYGDHVNEAEEVCKWFEKETGLSVMFYTPADMGDYEIDGRVN